MNFSGKTIWITGASSGMGKALAERLASENCRLIISDRDAEGMQATAEAIKLLGSEVVTVPLDMSDSKGIQDAVDKVLASGEKVDALYQFAGISQRSLAVETKLENTRRIMEVNYFGVVTLATALLPHMIENGGGQFAGVSSLVGKFGFPYRSAYSSSKHALHGFFESVLAENAKYNIKVSMIIPGRIDTNISKFAINKEGKEHGKMDPGQANGMKTDKAANVIFKGLKKEKKEILVGGKELLMVHIRRFLPSLYYKLAQKIQPM